MLDLRNNPGGLMTAALETASFFLQPGQVILSAKGRNVAETIERVPDDNKPYTFPAGGDRERQNGERIGDRFGSAAGSRPRDHRRRAELRQRVWCRAFIRCRRTRASR